MTSFRYRNALCLFATHLINVEKLPNLTTSQRFLSRRGSKQPMVVHVSSCPCQCWWSSCTPSMIKTVVPMLLSPVSGTPLHFVVGRYVVVDVSQRDHIFTLLTHYIWSYPFSCPSWRWLCSHQTSYPSPPLSFALVQPVINSCGRHANTQNRDTRAVTPKCILQEDVLEKNIAPAGLGASCGPTGCWLILDLLAEVIETNSRQESKWRSVSS